MEKRVYQVWQGSNKFIFGGRLIFGPDAKSLLYTLSLIIVPVVTFCIFVARHLRHEFSPDYAGYLILVVAVVFTAFVLVLLSLTSARDPGIVPRNAHPPEEEMHPTLQFPRTKEVMVNGVPVKVKYCDTCMLYRPPRCSHCSICDNCVERFDHHCPWVGQCIGLRNYRYFFMFISSSTLLCIYIFAMSVVYIRILMYDHHWTIWRAMKESPVCVALLVYCFIALWFVGGLTGFHLYLISTNQTTYENFRYRAENRINAHHLGCPSNFQEVFCTEVKPSRNNFRAFAQEEDVAPMTAFVPRRKTETVTDLEDPTTDRRQKVEDDLDIGEDILKISQRHEIEEITDDVTSRGSNGHVLNTSEVESDNIGSGHRAPVRSETQDLSCGRRSGSWDIASEDFLSSKVPESSSVSINVGSGHRAPIQLETRDSSCGRRSGGLDIASEDFLSSKVPESSSVSINVGSGRVTEL